MSAIIVVDALWGDSGKGKIAAYLAQKHQAAEESVMLNGATQIALTFCDHFDPQSASTRTLDALTSPIRSLISEITSRTQIPVTLIETGKYFEDIIDLVNS